MHGLSERGLSVLEIDPHEDLSRLRKSGRTYVELRDVGSGSALPKVDQSAQQSLCVDRKSANQILDFATVQTIAVPAQRLSQRAEQVHSLRDHGLRLRLDDFEMEDLQLLGGCLYRGFRHRTVGVGVLRESQDLSDAVLLGADGNEAIQA